MPNNHQDLAPDGSSTERRETLSEKVPGLWTFIVLILLMVAMGVAPTLRKHWEAETPPTTASPATAPDPTPTMEQALKAKLRVKVDTEIKQLAKDPK
jgi:hypothetical protein